MRGRGYAASVMGEVTELRLPADREYVVVAKRCAAALCSVAGFDLDAIDDLTIAVAQATENAIACLERSGALAGQVRVAFKLSARGLEVNVRSAVNRDAEMEARARLREQHTRAAGAASLSSADEDAVDLALRLMGLFVDDHSYRVDERTGGLRVRLTKYRAS